MKPNYLFLILSLVFVNCESNKTQVVESSIEYSRSNFKNYINDSIKVMSININPEHGFYTALSKEITLLINKIDPTIGNKKFVILNGNKKLGEDSFIGLLQEDQENYGKNIANRVFKNSIFEIDAGNGTYYSKFFIDYDYVFDLKDSEIIQKEYIGDSSDSAVNVYQTFITVKTNCIFYPSGNKEFASKQVIQHDSVEAIVSAIIL